MYSQGETQPARGRRKHAILLNPCRTGICWRGARSMINGYTYQGMRCCRSTHPPACDTRPPLLGRPPRNGRRTMPALVVRFHGRRCEVIALMSKVLFSNFMNIEFWGSRLCSGMLIGHPEGLSSVPRRVCQVAWVLVASTLFSIRGYQWHYICRRSI